jgi:hypothetical protein
VLATVAREHDSAQSGQRLGPKGLKQSLLEMRPWQVDTRSRHTEFSVVAGISLNHRVHQVTGAGDPGK